jgi:serine phosphatase RsbU (regulator of sigma subunit)
MRKLPLQLFRTSIKPVIIIIFGSVVLALAVQFVMRGLVNVLPHIITSRAAAAVSVVAERTAGSAADPLKTVHIATLEERTSLEGDWNIQLGDNPGYASAGYDDSRWDRLRLPAVIMQYYYGKKGFTDNHISGVLWVRKTINVDRGLPADDIGLILGRIGNADETFFNGVKIGGMGSFPPHEFSQWNHPRYYVIPKTLIRYGDRNVIAVRIWYHTWGEMLGTLAVTGIEDWQYSKTLSNFYLVTIDYIIIAMGLPILMIFFIFYIRRRSSTEYIFYCLQLLLGLVLILEICTFWNFYGDHLTRVKILIVAWAAINLTHPMFLHRIYNFKRPKFEMFLWMILIAIIILAIFFTGIEQARPHGAMGIVLLCGIGFYNFSCHISALYKKSPYAKLFSFFGCTVVIGAIHDGLFYLLKLVGVNVEFGFLFKYMVFPYSACVLYMGTTLVFVSRIIGMMDEIRDLNENLEVKVHDRTSELHSAMEEMESMNEQLIKTRDELWGEMKLAEKIQTVLLPDTPKIEGYDIDAAMVPADNVGGDFYDVINVDGHDWIIIGDVSGHGVTAGLVMMMVQTSIHTAIIQNPGLSPVKLLAVINRAITDNLRHLREDKYITITVFAAHSEGVFHFSGLHQDILVYRKVSDSVEIISTSGVLVGIEDDIENKISEDVFSLGPGDSMLIYTDGIIEAWRTGTVRDKRIAAEDMYGIERLSETFRAMGRSSAREIKEKILASMDDYQRTDDVSLVIVKRLS